jgi:hypothetical protein
MPHIGTVLTSNRKMVKNRATVDTPHDPPLSKLDAGTSVKRSRVEL